MQGSETGNISLLAFKLQSDFPSQRLLAVRVCIRLVNFPSQSNTAEKILEEDLITKKLIYLSPNAALGRAFDINSSTRVDFDLLGKAELMHSITSICSLMRVNPCHVNIAEATGIFNFQSPFMVSILA